MIELFCTSLQKDMGKDKGKDMGKDKGLAPGSLDKPRIPAEFIRCHLKKIGGRFRSVMLEGPWCPRTPRKKPIRRPSSEVDRGRERRLPPATVGPREVEPKSGPHPARGWGPEHAPVGPIGGLQENGEGSIRALHDRQPKGTKRSTLVDPNHRGLTALPNRRIRLHG